MSPKPTKAQMEEARAFIDRIATITRQDGHSAKVAPERYERAVRQAALMAAKVRPTK